MILSSCISENIQDNPFRLISLREIMEIINPSGLVGHGYNLMLYQSMPMVFQTFPRTFDVYSPVLPDGANPILTSLQVLESDCIGLGLIYTLPKVRRLIQWLQSESISYVELAAECKDIYERVNDELNTRFFFSIDSKYVPYYNDFTTAWAGVMGHFPSTLSDIEEASKCFALNRYTATVFHMMRVMEVGLRVLGASLKDPDLDPKTNPSWDRILRRCRAELSKSLQDRSPEWRSDEPFFSNASARLMAVKDAWRNPTMHVEQVYTEETSLDVFNHVQAFMRHLATKLHE